MSDVSNSISLSVLRFVGTEEKKEQNISFFDHKDETFYLNSVKHLYRIKMPAMTNYISTEFYPDSIVNCFHQLYHFSRIFWRLKCVNQAKLLTSPDRF